MLGTAPQVHWCEHLLGMLIDKANKARAQEHERKSIWQEAAGKKFVSVFRNE